MQKEFGIDVLLHLTCHLPREDLLGVLQRARDAGIRNILALRGDPPIGKDTWEAVEGGFSNAIDLVKLVREVHGDYFCIAVAAYPETHTECWSEGADAAKEDQALLDMTRLKEKIDAGADFIITQLFYDVEVYTPWLAKLREAGVSCPVLPGYMPIQNFDKFKKFQGWMKTRVPPRVWASPQPTHACAITARSAVRPAGSREQRETLFRARRRR